MAVTYGFYNSLNKDRVYSAEQMSSIFNGIITDGVFSTVGNALTTVAGSGMQVIVKPGRAWFNSTWTLNDSQLPLSIDAADVSLTRIDAVILEVNSAVSARYNSIKILRGIASANPVKPTLIASETLHQYALAYITVRPGATAITNANIEVNIGKTGCPFITSVLQQVNIVDLFNQWDAEFTSWFENVQAQLSGDVAANLQNQITSVTEFGYGKNGHVATDLALDGFSGLSSFLNQELNDMTINGTSKLIAVRFSQTTGWINTNLSSIWVGRLTFTGASGNDRYAVAELSTDEYGMVFLRCRAGKWTYSKVPAESDLGGKFRIGDLRTSLSSLGAPSSDWHLCDGTYFDKHDYPNFANMCSDKIVTFLSAPNGWGAIADSLKPAYVDSTNWEYKSYYIRPLRKVYCYTHSKNSSDYGSGNANESAINKCIIYDISTRTHEVKSWKATGEDITDACNPFGNYNKLEYKSGSNPKFYIFGGMRYDYDDDSGRKSIRLDYAESTDGANFVIKRQYFSLADEAPNNASIHLTVGVAFGKINVCATWGGEFDASGTLHGKIAIWSIDTITYSALTLSNARYVSLTDYVSESHSSYTAYSYFFPLYYTTDSAVVEKLAICIQYQSQYYETYLVTANSVSRLPTPSISNGKITFSFSPFIGSIDILPDQVVNENRFIAIVGTRGSSPSYYQCLWDLSSWKDGGSPDSVRPRNDTYEYVGYHNNVGYYILSNSGYGAQKYGLVSSSNFGGGISDSINNGFAEELLAPILFYQNGKLCTIGQKSILVSPSDGVYAKVFPSISQTGVNTFVRTKISE